MDWSAIGAIAELIGAIAVVVSLIYVAVQIRENSRALDATAVESVLAAHREIYHPICLDREVFDLVWRGSLDLESLEGPERARFMWLSFNMLKTMENFHYKYESGLLSDEVWRGWSVMFRSFLGFPGMETYWSLRRTAFAASFQAWVDSGEGEKRLTPTFDVIEAVMTLGRSEGRSE